MHGGDSLYSRMSGAHIYPDRLVDVELDHKSHKVSDRLSENINIIANEPSLAFFRIQEHVRKTLPQLVEQKHEVEDIQQQVQGACFDAEYDSKAVQILQKSSIHFENIQELLKNAMFMKQQIDYEDIRRRQSRLAAAGMNQQNGNGGYTSEDSGSNMADSAVSTDSSLAAASHTAAEAYDGGENYATFDTDAISSSLIESTTPTVQFSGNEKVVQNEQTVDAEHTKDSEQGEQVKQILYAEEAIQDERQHTRRTEQCEQHIHSKLIIQVKEELSQTEQTAHMGEAGNAEEAQSDKITITNLAEQTAKDNSIAQDVNNKGDQGERQDEASIKAAGTLHGEHGTALEDSLVVEEIPKTKEETEDKERIGDIGTLFAEQIRCLSEAELERNAEITTPADQVTREQAENDEVVEDAKQIALVEPSTVIETEKIQVTVEIQPETKAVDRVVQNDETATEKHAGQDEQT